VVEDEEALDLAIEQLIAEVRTSGPEAVEAAKELLRIVPTLAEDQVDGWTAEQIARRRATPEAREGMAAFLEKRAPKWAALKESSERWPVVQDDRAEEA
jgi:methylglutaconyl-CoA hydratase